jgi:hypothetical protein
MPGHACHSKGTQSAPDSEAERPGLQGGELTWLRSRYGVQAAERERELSAVERPNQKQRRGPIPAEIKKK